MIELNLLPDVKQEFVRSQRLSRKITIIMIITSIAAVGIVIFFAFTVYVVQAATNGLLDNSIKDRSEKLQKTDNLARNLTIQNQLKTLPELHDQKQIYSRLFTYLPTLNPAEPNTVKISKLDVNSEEGTITLEGYAKDYKAVAVFKDTLSNAELVYTDDAKQSIETKLFSDIAISDVGLGEDADGNQVTVFKATLTYDENAFKRMPGGTPAPTVRVPRKNTTPSAQQSSSVFGEASRADQEGAE